MPADRAVLTNASGEFYVRFPVVGNLLEALDEGRAEIEPWVLVEAGCWFALYPETATARIGEGSILNLGCMVAATERIDVGRHCMFANNCFLTDADHRFDDPELPVTWQGMRPKGPVTISDNCWFGTNCVVTGVPDDFGYLPGNAAIQQHSHAADPTGNGSTRS